MSPSKPSDWRDTWDFPKDWYDITGFGTWVDGIRVQCMYDPEVYGTVVVGDFGEFRVREDGERNSESEDPRDWRRVNE